MEKKWNLKYKQVPHCLYKRSALLECLQRDFDMMDLNPVLWYLAKQILIKEFGSICTSEYLLSPLVVKTKDNNSNPVIPKPSIQRWPSKPIYLPSMSMLLSHPLFGLPGSQISDCFPIFCLPQQSYLSCSLWYSPVIHCPYGGRWPV